MNKYTLLLSLLTVGISTNAQHNIDADAIRTDDARISGWATGCMVQRGWMDIADKGAGLATAGTEQNAIGPAGSAAMVVSLGDSGVAVLTFAQPIKNMEGPDFAVFENGFLAPEDSTKAFLEFAFVEVSSDGVNYVRFPAQYTGQDTAQVDNFTYTRGQDYVNLAGRYINGHGTPFDLEVLKDSAGLDVNNITHVRLVDVVGSIDPRYGSKDINGRYINDPYATAFASGGFDLTGVAVLNAMPNSVKERYNDKTISIAPNPAREQVKIFIEGHKRFSYEFVNINGDAILSGSAETGSSIDVSALQPGYYHIIIKYEGKKSLIKLIKQ